MWSNPAIVTALISAVSALVVGSVTGVLTWFFARPVQGADVASKHTTNQAELLDQVRELVADNDRRRKSESKLEYSLGAARRELADTRHVMHLLIEAIDQVVPLIPGVGNGELRRLNATLDKARGKVGGS